MRSMILTILALTVSGEVVLAQQTVKDGALLEKTFVEGRITSVTGKLVEVNIGVTQGAHKGDTIIILDFTGSKVIARREIAFVQNNKSFFHEDDLSLRPGNKVRLERGNRQQLSPATSLDQALKNMKKLADTDAQVMLASESAGESNRKLSARILSVSIIGDLGISEVNIIETGSGAKSTPRKCPAYQIESMNTRGLCYVFKDGLLIEESLLRNGTVQGLMVPIFIKEYEIKEIEKILRTLRMRAQSNTSNGTRKKGFVYNGGGNTPLSGMAKIIANNIDTNGINVFGRSIVIRNYPAAIRTAEQRMAYLQRELSMLRSAQSGPARGSSASGIAGESVRPNAESIVLKIIGAAALDATAKGLDNTELDSNDVFTQALFALGSAGSRHYRDMMIESALEEGFPDLPDPGVRAVRRVICMSLDGQLTFNNVAADTIKGEIIAALEKEDPTLGKAINIADFVYQVHEQYRKRMNSR